MATNTNSNSNATNIWKLRLKYKLRWHLLLVHFPISLFGVAFLFQVLHLIFSPACFTLGTTVVVLAGTLAMVPTTISGWTAWKRKYKGAGTRLFKEKIITAFAMAGVSIVLTTWRFTFYDIFTEEPTAAHWIFMTGTILLIYGSISEGYFGGKLTHRD